MREKGRYLELHYHADTRKVRTYLLSLEGNEEPLRFHAGFCQADMDAGWRQVKAIDASRLTAGDIDFAMAEVAAFQDRYWLDLAKAHKHDRVVCNGLHYTMHELGKGCGFGGKGFRVIWLDASKPPAHCNLSAQGRVPLWIRDRIPDNAASITEDNNYGTNNDGHKDEIAH